MKTGETRSYWGWGHEAEAVSDAEREGLALMLAAQGIDLTALTPLSPPPIASIALPPPRWAPPESLSGFVSQGHDERIRHTYGKAFRDVVRGLTGQFGVAPDAVALPRSDDEVEALLEWCSGRGVAVIPFGGGSSVVGGVEARLPADHPGAVSLDLRHLSGVTEVDVVSRAARIEAGTFGPAIESALRPHGLTLRHFPQSFEFSTLGGWVATRAGGHFATLYTHIDDLVESMTVLTPAGRIETRRLPGSGAGPSPDRLFLGSEGALGVIARAWMRVQERPVYRATASVRYDDVPAAATAARALAQSGLYPSNCRLLDRVESRINGVGDGTFLLVAFESADHPLDAWLDRALELCRDHHGEVSGERRTAPGAPAERGDASGQWRKMFLRGPYLRDALVRLGMVVETFETAVTWDRFEVFHRAVRTAARDAVRRVCGQGIVSARVTHLYPDGIAPYYTVIAPARGGGQLAQWDEIKHAVSGAILAAGGTITHHHAVGRDHHPWYRQQRPALYGAALAGAKRALDPAGILNPGVLST